MARSRASASRLSVRGLLLLSSLSLASPLQEERVPETYDYIIVGGGTSGLVVANRLSEDPEKTVLVIEHGYIDDGPLTKRPHAAVTDFPNAATWGVRSAPERHLNNATFGVTMADVVGGGSVINGMIADRGSRADYDAWETLGNEGWGFDGLLPYFRKSSNLTPLPAALAQEYNVVNDASGYGGGPVQIGYPTTWFPDMKNVTAALDAYGVPVSPRPETGDALGLVWAASTLDTRTGTRSHARVAYYDGVAARRPNLRLLTGTEVTEVLFEGLAATGVAFKSRKDGAAGRVTARREVVLAAGAISTPKLLQLSGLGPRSVLEAAGVDVKLDLPAVGANFQDHPYAITSWNLSGFAFPTEGSLATNASYNASAWDEYLTNHTGPLTWARGVSAAFVPLAQVDPAAAASIIADVEAQDPRDYLPDVYADEALTAGFRAQRAILVDHFGRDDAAVAEFPAGGFAIVMGALQKPLSRGTVTLNASDPRGPPVVAYHALANPADGRMLAGMARFIRGFYAEPLMAGYAPAEVLPGPGAQTDAEILAALVGAGLVLPSFAHPSGSCAMMPAALGGCVGADLLVHGVEGLSVVDASVMPLIPATHLQATVYAVAEKAADLIKAR